MTLHTDLVGLSEPGAELVIDLLGHAQPEGVQNGSAGLVEVLAGKLQEAANRGVLVVEALSHLARVRGGVLGEVLEAVLGVVGSEP